MAGVTPARAWLIPLPSGIPLEPLELTQSGRNRTLVLGRNEDCDLPLPLAAEKVSRRHAEFVHDSGRWRIADLGSRWGTSVNGVNLQPHHAVPLSEGDLVRIQPWTFRFSRERAATTGSVAFDDSNTTMVRTLGREAREPLRQDMLSLLLDGSSAIQAAVDEAGLAAVLLDLARRGTGMENATVLRALDAEGRVDEIVASSGSGHAVQAAMRFSRSLLAAASQGAVAEFSGDAEADVAQSIIQSNVAMAICAPLMLGTTVAAYLYLDSRGAAGQRPKHLRPNAAGFCQALCRMGGLALANLKRIDIERRAAHMEAELNAAAAAQRWILPREPIAAGSFVCVGQSRAGGYLGGDFFDAQVLADGRLAVCLGDVSGHGAAASVLMTAAQGFLHASLAAHGDLGRAIKSLNAFIQPRCPPESFVTLWTGIFDPKRMALDYIDAGHGYALLLKADQTVQALAENGGVPIGIDADFAYQTATVQLAPGERVLVISDGIIEQFGAESSPDGQRRQFDMDGVRAVIAAAKGDDLLAQLFQALDRFAGGKGYSDDVTGVLVQWPGQPDALRGLRLRGRRLCQPFGDFRVRIRGVVGILAQ
jgi:phosphoserine phosphatase RsbU/P